MQKYIKYLKENKPVAGLAALIMIIILSIFVSYNKGAVNAYDESKEEEFFPGFIDKVNSIKKVIVKYKGVENTIELIDGSWVFTDKNAYPVNIMDVKELVQNISELKILEKKTDNPDRFATLDLEDPNNNQSGSYKVTISSESGETLANFIVGNIKKGTSGDVKDEFYIRKSDEKQSYLVKGNMDVLRRSNGMLDNQIANISDNRLKSVSYKYLTDEKNYKISREAPMLPDFTLEDTNKDNIRSYPMLSDMASLISDLRFIDVTLARKIEFTRKETIKVVYETFDNLKINVNVFEKDGDIWAKIDAEGKGGSQNEANDLNNKLKAWAYKLDSRTGAMLTVKYKDLVK